jgi:hypothetical protein
MSGKNIGQCEGILKCRHWPLCNQGAIVQTYCLRKRDRRAKKSKHA